MKKVYKVSCGNDVVFYEQGFNNLYNRIKFLVTKSKPAIIKKVEVLNPTKKLYDDVEIATYFENNKHKATEKRNRIVEELYDLDYRPHSVGINDCVVNIMVNYAIFSLSYNIDLGYIVIRPYETKEVFFFSTELEFFNKCKGFKRCRDLHDVITILAYEPKKILSVLAKLELIYL